MPSMRMPKRVPTYLKNAAKSMGYMVSDVFRDYNPVINSMYTDVKDSSESLYQTIKEWKGDTGKINFKKEFTETSKAIMKNFKDDMRSGNWYNKERQNNVINAAAMLGFDESDFSFDDWGDDDWSVDSFDDDDTKAVINEEKKSTQQVLAGVDRVGAAVAGAVNEGQMASANYIAQVENQNTQMMYALNQKGFSTVTEAIIQVNNSIAALGSLGQPLTAHMQNSGVFFTKTTEQLNSISEKLDQLVKNTTVATSGGNGRTKRNGFHDMINADDMFDMKSYMDMVKENFKDDKELLDLAKGALKGVNLKNISPGVVFGRMITKALVPKMLKDSMSTFNDTLKTAINDFMIKSMHKVNGSMNPLAILFGDKFIPDGMFGKLKSYDTSRYEKGPIQWDGISKKALTEVIPTTLFKIYSALTGTEEMRYDYNNGKFVTKGSIRGKIDEQKASYARRAGGDLRDLAIRDINASFEDKSDPKYKRMIDEAEKFFLEQALESDDPYLLAKLMNPAATSTFAQYDPRFIDKLSRIVRDKKNGRAVSRYTTQKFSARSSYNRAMGEQNDLFAQYYNDANWKTSGAGRGMTDKYGNTMFDYAFSIAQDVKYIALASAYSVGGKGSAGNLATSPNGRVIHGMKVNPNFLFNTSVNTGERTTLDRDRSNDDYYRRYYELGHRIEDNALTVEELRNKGFNEKLDSVRGQIGDYFKDKGLARGIAEAPAAAASVMLTRVSEAMQKVIIGDPDNPESGIFGKIATKAGELFDTLKEKLKDFFEGGAKDLIDKLFGTKGEDGNRSGGFFSDFYNETKGSLRQGFHYVRDQAQELAWGRAAKTRQDISNQQRRLRDENAAFAVERDQLAALLNNGQAARGRRVTRSGLAIVSEGEMIIPASMNPYYHGPAKYKDQSRRERMIARSLGMYAGGTAAVNLAGSDETASAFGSVAGNIVKTISKNGTTRYYEVYEDASGKKKKRAIKTEDLKNRLAFLENNIHVGAEQIKELGKRKFQESVAAGEVGEGGLIGGALGEIVKFGRNIKNANITLTGDKEPKEMNANISDLLGDLKKGKGNIGAGAIIGGLGAGAILGGPFGIAGLVAGSAIGFVKSSATAQRFLFGDDILDENGEATGKHKGNGILGKKFTEFADKNGLKQMGARAAIGGAAGAILGGPLGAVGGLVAGSAIGFVKNSESAQEFLFGKVDENGKRDYSGILPKSVVDFFSKNKNAGALMGAGAGIGALFGGPLGAVGGLAVGAGINYFNSSEDFRKRLFGENGEGGMLSEFKKDILDNIKETFMNTGNALMGWLRVTGRTLTDHLKNGISWIFGRVKGGAKSIGDRLGISDKLSGIGTKLYDGIAGFTTRRADKRLGRNISKGYLAYNKELGRNMSSAEIFKALKDDSRNISRYTKGGRDYAADYEALAGLDSEDARKSAREELLAVYNDKSNKSRDRKRAFALMKQIDKDSELAKAEEAAKSPELKVQEVIKDTTSKISDTVKKIASLLAGGEAADKIKAELNATDEEMSEGEALEKRQEAGKKTIWGIFGQTQIKYNDQGEQIIDDSDGETDKTQEKVENFNEAMKQIPVISGDITGVKGLFAHLKNKLVGSDGEGDEEESGGIFGKNSIFGKLGNFLTSGKGLKGVIIGALKNVVAPALLVAAFSGKFDSLIAQITKNSRFFNGGDTGTASALDDNRNFIVNGKQIALNADGTPITNENGDYQTVDGQWVAGDAQAVGSDTSFHKQLIKNTATGFLRKGIWKTNASVASRVIGNTTVAKKFAAIGGADLAKAVAKNAGQGLRNTFANLCEKIPKVLTKLGNILGKTSIGKAMIEHADDIATGLFTHIDDAVKVGGKAVAKVAQKLSQLIPIITIAYAVAKGVNAWGNAETILGITEDATVGQRCFAVLISVVNAIIPVIGDLFPDKMLVNVLISILKMIPGLRDLVADLDAQRNRAEEEVRAYNEANGTDLSIEEYNQMNGKAGVFTQIGLSIKSSFTNIKERGLKNVLVEESRENGAIDSVMGTTTMTRLASEGKIVDLIKFAFTGSSGVEEGSDKKESIAHRLARTSAILPRMASLQIYLPMAIGSIVKNKISSLVPKFKESDLATDMKSFAKASDALSEAAKTGKLGEVAGVKFESVSKLGGLFNAIFSISRLFNFAAAMFYKVKNNGLSETIKEGAATAGTIFAKANGAVSDWGDSTLSENVKKSGVLKGAAKTAIGNVYNGAKGAINKLRDILGIGSGIFGGASGFVSQRDPRYAGLQMTGGSFGQKGCGPAVASMLTNGNLSVDQALAMSRKYQDARGVSMDYFKDVLASQGLHGRVIGGSSALSSGIMNSLARGNKVVIAGRDGSNNSKRYSPFGPNMHYVLATGVDPSGKIILNDPEMRRPTKYDPSILRGAKAAISAGGATKGTMGDSAVGVKKTTVSSSSSKIDSAALARIFAPMIEGETGGKGAAYMENMGGADGTSWNYGVGSFTTEYDMPGFMDFLRQNYPNLASQLKGAVGTSEFNNSWKALAASQNQAFTEAQEVYTLKTKTMPAIDKIKAGIGLDLNNGQYSEGVISLLSTAVNWKPAFASKNGWKAGGGASFFSTLRSGMSNSDAVDGIYNTLMKATNSYQGGKSKYYKGWSTRWNREHEGAKAMNNLFHYDGSSITSSGVASSTGGTSSTAASLGLIGNVINAFSTAFSPLTGSTSSESTDGTSSVASTNFPSGSSPIDFMKGILGTIKYSMDGPRNPDKGSADCSSTVRWAIKKAGGPDIGADCGAQYENSNLIPVVYNNGSVISSIPAEAQPNDVMFFKRNHKYAKNRKDQVGHVGLYLGNNQYIDHGSGMGPKIKEGPGKDLIKISRINMGSTAAAGSGLFDRGVYKTHGNLLGISGGASAIGTSNGLVERTTQMLTSVSNNAKARAADGSISADIVAKLLKAITTILSSIADNTSPVQKIYNLLENYTGVATAQKAEAIANNNKSSEVDPAFKELLSALTAIAQG